MPCMVCAVTNAARANVAFEFPIEVERAQDRVLGSGEAKWSQRLVHRRAERVLRALERVAETAGQELRHVLG
jgi:hypothetical protein